MLERGLALQHQAGCSIWWQTYALSTGWPAVIQSKKPGSVAGLDFCCFAATRDKKHLSTLMFL
jgi:hypothetical protein